MSCLAALCLVGAMAVDGDTLELRGVRYRLWGINAPEWTEPGGQAAYGALRSIVHGETLHCDVMDVDRFGRPVVRCILEVGYDVACTLVANGYAVDWPRYSGGYYSSCRR